MYLSPNGFARIDSIQEFDKLLKLNKNKDIECFIALNFGCRGSHTFTYFSNTKEYQHYDEVSGYMCDPEKTLEKLVENTNVPDAIGKHAFWIHDYCVKDLKFPKDIQ
jgi:hypothetical protein